MTELRHVAQTMAAQCAAHRARQVSRLLTRVYDDCLRPLGVQESQFSLLVAVATVEDGVPMKQLAKALLMDPTTLTRNVVPLEKAGLLQVARSASDGRARIVLLTRAGRRVVEDGYPLWKQAQRRIERVLGRAGLDALHAHLGEVVAQADRLEP